MPDCGGSPEAMAKAKASGSATSPTVTPTMASATNVLRSYALRQRIDFDSQASIEGFMIGVRRARRYVTTSSRLSGWSDDPKRLRSGRNRLAGWIAHFHNERGLIWLVGPRQQIRSKEIVLHDETRGVMFQGPIRR